MKQAKYFTNIKSQQCGFTIIEIMVAITLSMILIAGVIQIYLSSKESFRVQNELSRLQENQRIAIEFLQRDISKAGFVPYNGSPIPVANVTVVDGGGNNSDSITIAYTFTTDCLGAATPNGIAVNTYTINPATLQLMCLGNGGGVAQPIADGIENMQIVIGEDVVNNSTMGVSADRYVNPATVVTNIVSVRIALLARSQNPIRSQATVQNFTLLDSNINQNDRIKRQVVTTTIPFRNPIGTFSNS
ncbi:PilW family protein [Kaarinaea lacus]